MGSQSHRRPLPLTPPQQRSRFQRSSVHHCPGLRDQEDTQRDTPLGHGELRRRETVHWFPLLKESESEQEHIYEEIHEEMSDESDEELTKEEVSPHSFPSSASRGGDISGSMGELTGTTAAKDFNGKNKILLKLSFIVQNEQKQGMSMGCNSIIIYLSAIRLSAQPLLVVIALYYA